jgi:arsenate reductase
VDEKKSVLFVCVGNACRSQMAEGFARAYGSDVIEAASAGLAPAFSIPLPTLKIMDEKNILLSGQFPKGLDALPSAAFDTVVNISGRKLPAGIAGEVLEWDVRDPIGAEEAVYREVRDQIEGLVMRLVLAARVERDAGVESPPPRRKFLR